MTATIELPDLFYQKLRYFASLNISFCLKRTSSFSSWISPIGISFYMREYQLPIVRMGLLSFEYFVLLETLKSRPSFYLALLLLIPALLLSNRYLLLRLPICYLPRSFELWTLSHRYLSSMGLAALSREVSQWSCYTTIKIYSSFLCF
jgi:hypothetical protein